MEQSMNQMTESEIVAEVLMWDEDDTVFSIRGSVILADNKVYWLHCDQRTRKDRLSPENCRFLVDHWRRNTVFPDYNNGLLAQIRGSELEAGPIEITFENPFLYEGRLITNQEELEDWFQTLK
jgi:hypothetical protein